MRFILKSSLHLIAVMGVSFVISSCGGDSGGTGGPSPIPTAQPTGESPTPTPSPTPDPSGAINNISSVFVAQKPVAAGAVCPAGGVEIEMGFDVNENNQLDDAEVVNTEVICNGENGSNGADGANGINGLNGEDGENGANSLVNVSDEPGGSNCAWGGIKIDVGLDTNVNDYLDVLEISATRYVCDGVSGTSSTTDPCSLVEGANDSLVLYCGDDEYTVDGGIEYQTFDLATIDGGYRISDSWLASGGRSLSRKNPRYDFEVSEAGNIAFSFGSPSDFWTYVYVYDQLGTRLQEWAYTGSTDENRVFTPGIYTLVVGTYDANRKGNFEIDLVGPIASVKKHAVQRVELKEESWKSSGGRTPHSPRNRHYTFTVLQDTILTIDIETGVSVSWFLLDENQDALVNDEGVVTNVNVPVTAGEYHLIVGSYYPYEAGNFDLTVTGEFDLASFKSILYPEFEIISGAWQRSGGQSPNSYRNHHYRFTANSDGYIDFSFSSNVNMACWLLDSNGLILFSDTSQCTRVLQAVEGDKEYTFVLGTYYLFVAENYLLRTSGDITEPVLVDSVTSELTGAWVSAGGQNAPAAPGNIRYTLVVTQETMVDIFIDHASGYYAGVYLLNDIGVTVAYDSNSQSSERERLSAIIQPGIYTVVATAQSGQSGTFKLNVNGLIDSFAIEE